MLLTEAEGGRSSERVVSSTVTNYPGRWNPEPLVCACVCVCSGEHSTMVLPPTCEWVSECLPGFV